MSVRYRLGLFLWLGISLAWMYAFVFLLPYIEFAWLLTLCGILLADAGSYVFHYLVDHYGQPVPGSLVHEFQRHHLFPHGIAEKPVSEVLYPAVRVVVPASLLMGVLLAVGWLPLALALLGFVVLSCWVLAQLFHRWAHMRPPALVRMAQDLRLLVSVREHALHHTQPYDTRFAVITGWSNFLLDRLGAPRLLDWLMWRFGKQKRGLVRSLDEISAFES